MGRLLIALACCLPLIACSKLADFPDKSPGDGDVDAPDDGMDVGDLVDVDPDNPDVVDPDATDVATDRPTDIEAEDEPCVEAIPAIDGDVRITFEDSPSQYPILAWTGSEYGVAWQYTNATEFEIYFARIDAEGAYIGPDELITTYGVLSDTPSLVWADDEFGIAWADDRHGASEIYFARITAEGTMSGSNMRITNAGDSSRYPELAWSGSEYGLTWEDQRNGGREVFFVRLSRTGDVAGSEYRVTADPAGGATPSIAWSGSEYGIAWWDTIGVDEFLYFRRVTATGNPSDTVVTVQDDPAQSRHPSLVWTGSEFGVAWYDREYTGNEILFNRIAPNGEVRGESVRLTTGGVHKFNPSLVWADGVYGVSWYNWISSSDVNEIYFTWLSGDGLTVEPITKINSDGTNGSHPSLVWSGSEFGITWSDVETGNDEIYFNLIHICP